MATSPCVILYGNSVFLAGIRAGGHKAPGYERLPEIRPVA